MLCLCLFLFRFCFDSNVFAEIKKREALNIQCPENKGLTQIQFQERDINGIKQFRVNYNCGKV